MSVKIGIIGAGNLGKVLATLLCSSGHDVEIAIKRKTGVKIDKRYLYEIEGDFGNISSLVPTVDTVENFTSKKDIIICAVRNYDVASTAKRALSLLEDNGTIITIHNVFAVNEIMRIIPDYKSVCIFCDFACTELNNKIYVNNSNGMTIGVYSKDAKSRLDVVTQIFSRYCDVHFAPDVFGEGISRTIINNAISALGALTGDCLGDVLSKKEGRQIFCKLIEETVAVCKRYRIKINKYNNQLDYYKFIDKSFKGRKYQHFIIKLLRKQNGFIRSSALLDLERGKKPELLYLMQSFMVFAKKSKVDISYITRVYNMLVSIFNGEIRIEKNNIKKLIN